MTYAVRTEDLGRRFGDTEALAGLDLCVRPGTVLGLLGHNGAGKTTAVRILTTLLAPTTGRAFVAGHDVATDPRAVRASISLAGQQASLDERLTGRENLMLLGRLQLLSKREAMARARELLRDFGIEYAADRQVGDLQRRHAPAPGPGGLHGRAPAGDLPRRADHRAGPVEPRRDVDGDRAAGAGRRRAAAHDPVPGGGGPAGRRDRGPQRRPDRGGGHARRAQGARRRPARSSVDHGRRRAGHGGAGVRAPGPGARRPRAQAQPARAGRPRDLTAALDALAAAGIAVDEAALSQPTLDDAFFALAT